MLSDLRMVFRGLLRDRVFALVTVATLALGIGAAAAIFNVTDWILFESDPTPPDVFLVTGSNSQQALMPVRFDYMTRAYEQTQAMGEYAKAVMEAGNVVVDREPVGVGWLAVSPNLFGLIGVHIAVGRGFTQADSRHGADDAAIVGEPFCRKYLGEPSGALGRKIRVGASVCTVVGVLRQGRGFPPYFYSEVYRPLAYKVDPNTPWIPALWTLGRLRPGVTREQAQEMLRAAKVDPPGRLRDYLADDRPALSKIADVNRAYAHPEAYWVMLSAVGLLYCIACLNASNLMLVRMLGRRREMSIRLALGGGPWRIVRLLAAESLSLAALASLGGFLTAQWLVPLLLRAAGTGTGAIGYNGRWMLDGRSALVLGLLALATALFIAAVPAWTILRSDVQAGLKDGGAVSGESPALARLRGAFVVAETAFAIVLLCGAGLMVRTLQNFGKIDPGFDAADRLKIQLAFPPNYPTEINARLARLRGIQAMLQRVPGVRAAGFGGDIVLPGYEIPTTEIVKPDGGRFKTAVTSFGNGFQEAAGLRLLRGRWFTHKQGDHVLVSASLARELWPNQDPVGQYFRAADNMTGGPPGWKGWCVDGVVADLRPTLRGGSAAAVYGPETWAPFNFNTFVLRLSRPYDAAMAGLLRRELYAHDPQLVVTQVLSIGELDRNQLWAEHLTDSVLRVLSGMAVLLTVVGIFSVLAYTVSRRMTEFGVRMALGATRRDLVAVVMGRGVRLAAAGFALGLGGAFALTRFLQSLLYQTSPGDPLILVGVTAVFLLVAALGCALPAYRASRVDPARLLRSE